jgi:Domain of unknown function (DUF4398)
MRNRTAILIQTTNLEARPASPVLRQPPPSSLRPPTGQRADSTVRPFLHALRADGAPRLGHPPDVSRLMTFLLVSVLFASCSIFIGCAGQPVAELREARTAIQAAKQAGAEKYAPEPLSVAVSSFNEAEEGKAVRDDLKELYVRAAMQAKIAAAEARQAAAEESLRRVQADLAKAKEAAAEAKHSAEEATRELGQPVP